MRSIGGALTNGEMVIDRTYDGNHRGSLQSSLNSWIRKWLAGHGAAFGE
jgi:hypothetical protein